MTKTTKTTKLSPAAQRTLAAIAMKAAEDRARLSSVINAKKIAGAAELGRCLQATR